MLTWTRKNEKKYSKEKRNGYASYMRGRQNSTDYDDSWHNVNDNQINCISFFFDGSIMLTIFYGKSLCMVQQLPYVIAMVIFSSSWKDTDCTAACFRLRKENYWKWLETPLHKRL